MIWRPYLASKIFLIVQDFFVLTLTLFLLKVTKHFSVNGRQQTVLSHSFIPFRNPRKVESAFLCIGDYVIEFLIKKSTFYLVEKRIKKQNGLNSVTYERPASTTKK